VGSLREDVLAKLLLLGKVLYLSQGAAVSRSLKLPAEWLLLIFGVYSCVAAAGGLLLAWFFKHTGFEHGSLLEDDVEELGEFLNDARLALHRGASTPLNGGESLCFTPTRIGFASVLAKSTLGSMIADAFWPPDLSSFGLAYGFSSALF
jgi:hypothetical protein